MPVLIVQAVDKDTGKPAFNVSVLLEELNMSHPTNYQGEARFVVPRGTYTLVVGGGMYDIIRRKITVDRDKRIKVVLRRILLV